VSDEIPKTRLAVELGEAARLRVFIRRAELVNGRIAGARLAQPADAAALAALLSHESIGTRISTMPSSINAQTMERFIGAHLEERARGEDILLASFNAMGEARAYFDVQVWLEWSIAKFGGACGLAAVE
jgi:hypothetical protein